MWPKRNVLWKQLLRFTLSVLVLAAIIATTGANIMGAFSKVDVYALVIVILGSWMVLQWYGKMPQLRSVIDLITAANSRGGNIVILTFASVYFFSHSIRLFYLLLSLSQEGKVSQDNAFALMALQFATSTAFGGAFGALLKTMTGENSKSRASDDPNYKPSETPVTPTVKN